MCHWATMSLVAAIAATEVVIVILSLGATGDVPEPEALLVCCS